MTATLDSPSPILAASDDRVLDALLATALGARLRSAPRNRVLEALGETMMLAELILDAAVPDRPLSVVTVDPIMGNVDEGRWHALLRPLLGFSSRIRVESVQASDASGGPESGLRDYINFWDPVRTRRVSTREASRSLPAAADVCVIYFWNYGSSLALLQDAIARCKAVYIVDFVRAGTWVCKRYLRECGASVSEVKLTHGLAISTRKGVAGHRYALRVLSAPQAASPDASDEVRNAHRMLQNHLMGRTVHGELDTLLPGSPCTIAGEPGIVLDHLRGIRQVDGVEYFLDGRRIGDVHAPSFLALAAELAELRASQTPDADEQAFWKVRSAIQSLVEQLDQSAATAGQKSLVDALRRRGIEVPPPYLPPGVGESALFAAATGDLAAFAQGDLVHLDRPRRIDRATPLLMAIRTGNADIAQALVALRANANATDIHGWSALAYATILAQEDTRNALLAAGAQSTFRIPGGMDMEELRLHAAEAYAELEPTTQPASAEVAGAQSLAETPLEEVPAVELPQLRPPTKPAAPERATDALEPVLACAVELSPKAGESPNDRVRKAAAAVLQWLRTDKKIALGDEAEFASANATVSCESTDHLWALRFDDLNDHINGRLWRVEVVLTALDGAAYGTVSVQRAGPKTPSENFSIPRVLKRLVSAVGLRDAGLELGSTAYPARTPAAVDGLVRLISEPARRLPVVVIVEPDGIEPLMDPKLAAERLAGVAHVIALSPAASFTFTRKVGRELSVFGAAMRIFRPGFTTEDPGQKHPLRISRPDKRSTTRVGDLVRLVVPMTRALAVEDQVPSFSLARALARRAARRVVDPLRGLLDQAALKELREEVRFLEELVDEQANEFARYRQSQESEQKLLLDEIDLLENQLRSARAKNEALEAAFATSSQVSDREEISYPDSLAGFGDWVDRWMSADVVVLPRARRNVEKSDVEDASLCYKALDLLCNYYVPMKRSRSPEKRRAFEEKCAEFKLEVCAVGGAVDDRRFRDHYRARHAGEEVRLDMHIKGPSARNRRHQFRVYFSYLEDQGVAVVGHMPEHLPNSLTD